MHTKPITNSLIPALILASLFITTLTLMPERTARADSGFYIGGSVGDASVQADIPDANNVGDVFEFDESDFAWKAFGGYNFDLAFIDLAVEGGYVDLGSPSGNVRGTSVELDVTGWDIFALAGLELGPIGVFAKVGLISWDTDTTLESLENGGDSGTDPAYGVGARLSLGSFEVRGEFEYFDLETTNDVYLLSAGLAYTF